MTGYPDGGFSPDSPITRAEVTVMFSRLLTETMDADTDYPVSFPDVPDTWYTAQIGFMEQYGIVEGYEDGMFRPEQAVTRAEFAVIASKFAELTDTEENIFTDVPDDYWGAPYILLAHKNGWVDGYGDGTFKPLNSITRAEVVSTVNRMLERVCDKTFADRNTVKTYADTLKSHWAYYDITEASNGHLYTKDPDEVWSEIVR